MRLCPSGTAHQQAGGGCYAIVLKLFRFPSGYLSADIGA